jgi:hypothetical protein
MKRRKMSLMMEVPVSLTRLPTRQLHQKTTTAEATVVAEAAEEVVTSKGITTSAKTLILSAIFQVIKCRTTREEAMETEVVVVAGKTTAVMTIRCVEAVKDMIIKEVTHLAEKTTIGAGIVTVVATTTTLKTTTIGAEMATVVVTITTLKTTTIGVEMATVVATTTILKTTIGGAVIKASEAAIKASEAAIKASEVAIKVSEVAIKITEEVVVVTRTIVEAIIGSVTKVTGIPLPREVKSSFKGSMQMIIK